MTTKNKSNEIKITRMYDAPLKVVWEAWSDPKQAAKWWGPRGFTLTTHSKDFRSGGTWDYTMHGPDGTDYPNISKYLEVETYARMVYDHGGRKDRPPMFRVTVLFTHLEEKTKMDMTMAFPTPEVAETTRKFIIKAGGDATWDRLAEYLTKHLAKKETFVINRTFDSPIAKMYDLWTSPEHIMRWLAPKGFEGRFLQSDIKPGGSTFYEMTGPDNSKMYGKAKYLEMTKPLRIVYTQQFADEKGNVTRHPMSPTWPETMQTTVSLTEEGKERTRVMLTWEVHGKATREEMDTFVNARAGMTQGWTGSFDKLEAYLSELR